MGSSQSTQNERHQSVEKSTDGNGNQVNNKFENKYEALKARRVEMITRGEDLCDKLVQEMKHHLNTIITLEHIKQKITDKLCKYVNVVFHIDNLITDGSAKAFREKSDACTFLIPLTTSVHDPENTVTILDRMHTKMYDNFFRGFKITYNRNMKLSGVHYNKSLFIFEIEVTKDNYECPLKNKETETKKKQETQSQPQTVGVIKSRSYSEYDSDSDEQCISSKIKIVVEEKSKPETENDTENEDRDEFYELYNKFAEDLNSANMKVYNNRFDGIVVRVQNDLLNRFAYQSSYEFSDGFEMGYIHNKLNKDARLASYADIIVINTKKYRDGNSKYTSFSKVSPSKYEIVFKYE
ncbi:MAG: hypothetical protein Terrestrivirus1_227 [Terrestrivirus sp.]|uniref:Uncharacterized protein n=1 Tax=Terrestrivirus sp. TaxID=2487775 RepID=A0A3G4ZP35_9VIRU|nr:MAG: hypothetical protein Terrestrivirus1_227 [Terrestrivirus sp.]